MSVNAGPPAVVRTFVGNRRIELNSEDGSYFTRVSRVREYSSKSFPGAASSKISSNASGPAITYVSRARQPAGMFSIASETKVTVPGLPSATTAYWLTNHSTWNCRKMIALRALSKLKIPRSSWISPLGVLAVGG